MQPSIEEISYGYTEHKEVEGMNYCTCKTPHLCVPGNISTARCVYCGKPPYGVYIKEGCR